MNPLFQKLQTLPKKPGVYLFRNEQKEVLYVGKAKNLKHRIKSYFQNPARLAVRTRLLVEKIQDLDYVIVSSETESLILESSFIKQYRPRFNVRLRDDKNYQFIKLDYEQAIPQIYPVRKIGKADSKNKYFGPYTSAATVRETLNLLRRLFQICSNKRAAARPCFQYHLGRCLGVCIGKISPTAYRRSFRQIEKFLNHRQGEILKALKTEMKEAAQKRRFEKAATLRDKVKVLERLWEKQKIVFTKKVSQDYFSLFILGQQAVFNLFAVRGGKIVHQEIFEAAQAADTPPPIVLGSFLKQYYAEASSVPRELVIPYEIEDRGVLQSWLGIKINVPRRGRKFKLLKLGEENARNYFEKHTASFERLLSNLQASFGLPKIPRRIEAYDISNVQGSLPVGSMVVFENGQPKKSEYRKFKIRLKQTPDDVAMLKEMLTRRLARVSSLRGAGRRSNPNEIAAPATKVGARNDTNFWPLPDLILVDGGKGQLNAALETLKAPGLKLPVVALAKRLEEVFIPGQKHSIKLPDDSPEALLLQRIRDEAHRFAISFYRKRHRAAEVHSRLDDVPGIGPATKKKLLTKFGNVSAIRAASIEALAAMAGVKIAKNLKERL